MDTCQPVTFIETTLLRRGEGIKGDPIRIITQYWDQKGTLCWEIDPCSESKMTFFNYPAHNDLHPSR